MINWKKLETSKRILYVIAALVILLLPIVVLVSCMTGDVNPLTQYVIGVFALASIAVGFYYWKSKNENLHKYAKKDSPSEIEAVHRLSEELNK